MHRVASPFSLFSSLSTRRQWDCEQSDTQWRWAASKRSGTLCVSMRCGGRAQLSSCVPLRRSTHYQRNFVRARSVDRSRFRLSARGCYERVLISHLLTVGAPPSVLRRHAKKRRAATGYARGLRIFGFRRITTPHGQHPIKGPRCNLQSSGLGTLICSRWHASVCICGKKPDRAINLTVSYMQPLTEPCIR